MAKQTSTGECSLCSGIFSKAAMTKHLESCKRSDTSSGNRSPAAKRLFHILVEGRDLPEYWLHLEAQHNMKLQELDDFLREIWLECCGHLSQFIIDGQDYISLPDKEMDPEDTKDMKIAIGDVLKVGMKFDHEYDFGTATELILRVISEREANVKGKKIQLLARNTPPSFACESCGKPAAHVCAQCIYEGKGWVCDDCSGEHECGDEMLLPAVNSPRVGMCGYTG